MKKDILFTLPSYFRDDMNIMAYRFGKGEKTCAVVGALRGDEVQQLYVCARLVSFLREVLKAPVTGMLFFMQDGPFITEHSPVFQVLAGA